MDWNTASSNKYYMRPRRAELFATGYVPGSLIRERLQFKWLFVNKVGSRSAINGHGRGGFSPGKRSSQNISQVSSIGTVT